MKGAATRRVNVRKLGRLYISSWSSACSFFVDIVGPGFDDGSAAGLGDVADSGDSDLIHRECQLTCKQHIYEVL